MELNLLSAHKQHLIQSRPALSELSRSANLLDGQFALNTLEAEGEHAWVTTAGITQYGWIMQRSEFVTYEGSEQTVRRLYTSDVVDYIDKDGEPLQSLITLHGVIRFKRDLPFPRFRMEENERWSLCIPQDRDKFMAIERGECFRFAGGMCHPYHVEVIYIGPADKEYRRAMGYTGAAI